MLLHVFRWLAFALALALCPTPSGGTEPNDFRRRAQERDDQWILRTVSNGGTQRTIAVFLSWNYSEVIFRAWCEAPGRLLFQYFGDTLNRVEPMALIVGPNTDRHLAWQMEARVATDGSRSVLEGQMFLTGEMRAALVASEDEIGIDAPNEMGEPWYVGSAPALKQVIAACR